MLQIASFGSSFLCAILAPKVASSRSITPGPGAHVLHSVAALLACQLPACCLPHIAPPKRVAPQNGYRTGLYRPCGLTSYPFPNPHPCPGLWPCFPALCCKAQVPTSRARADVSQSSKSSSPHAQVCTGGCVYHMGIRGTTERCL